MAASQLALSERRVVIYFVIDARSRYRSYVQQAHSVFSNAFVKIGHRPYRIPELVFCLRDKKHTFKYYKVLLSYFCHELVSADTHICSPGDEVSDITDLKEIGDHLRSLDTRYLHSHIELIHPDGRTCAECIKQLSLLYMKTTLEHRYMSLDSKKNFYHSEREHMFGEWVAKSLFNQDTPFSKTSNVHCRISHIVYASLLQETYFYSEAYKFFVAIENELELYLGNHPVTAELLILQGKDVPEYDEHKKNRCALEFILDYMNYNVDTARKIYWVVAYLLICRAALANNGVFDQRKTPSLLFYNACRRRFQPFYFKSAKTKKLLFCCREEEIN